jgi:hypothetical protein
VSKSKKNIVLKDRQEVIKDLQKFLKLKKKFGLPNFMQALGSISPFILN